MAAKKRITGAIATTAHLNTLESQPGSKAEVTPSTGASSNVVASAVVGPSGPATTGSAISATSDMPT